MLSSPTRLKLSRHSFLRFWSAHAWTGVITSLVVYVMFLLGSVVLFYEPLTIWEEPLQQRPAPALHSLQDTLGLVPNLPDEFYFYLPKYGRGLPKLAYFVPGTTQWRTWWIDPLNARVIPQREMAAAFVYDLHYLWHEATGYWLQYGAGVLVFGFLVALLTGLFIHLQNLTRQLQRFRPDRGSRVLWSDLHKVLGVFGLPFQFVYAVTGSLMVLAPLLFTLAVKPVFGGNELRAAEAAGNLIEDPPARDYGQPASALRLDELVSRARAALPGLTPESFIYRGYGREHATVDVRGELSGQALGAAFVRLGAARGSVEKIETRDRERTSSAVARWLHGLHTVEYGGPWARVLMFVLALFGCMTILSGNWIWIARRAEQDPSYKNALLARLTAGVGGGTILALASLFFVSRVLPLELEARPRVEETSLATAFLGAVTWALLSNQTLRVWWQQLGLAGGVLFGVPWVAARHSVAGLFGAGPRQIGVCLVDAAFLGLGLGLMGLALALRKIEIGRATRAHSSGTTELTASRGAQQGGEGA